MLSNSSVLNSMTIRLKHMHYLDTSTYVMGSKVNLGSLGVLQKRAGYVSLQRHNLLSSSSSYPVPQSRISGYCYIRYCLLGVTLPASAGQGLVLHQFLLLLLLLLILAAQRQDLVSYWVLLDLLLTLPASGYQGIVLSSSSSWGHRGQKVILHQYCFLPYPHDHGQGHWLHA